MKIKYKPQAIPAIIYLLISSAALIYVFVAPLKESMAGVGVAVLTIPWSFIGVSIIDSMRLDSDIINIGLAIIGIIINTVILLLVCGYFRKDN